MSFGSGFGGLLRRPGLAPLPRALEDVFRAANAVHVPMPSRLDSADRAHLKGTAIDRALPPDEHMLSVLIPTLASRSGMLSKLCDKLERQIGLRGPVPEVEVLIFEDSGERTIGEKRNRLLEEACGRYVVSVDDDDDISDDYVAVLLDAVRSDPSADCIGLRAIMTTSGKLPVQMVYTLQTGGIVDENEICYRPPMHLTPIRRSIAARYRFKETNFGEDSDWALRMLADGALKSEIFVDRVVYHYRCQALR